MRILLVEDEPSISGFLKEGLEEEGFAVDVADNGRVGLELALDLVNEYDILLLDWMLPILVQLLLPISQLPSSSLQNISQTIRTSQASLKETF